MSSKLIVAVVGSRDFPNAELVKNYIDKLHFDVHIVSGGARGVDRIAAQRARARGMQVTEIKADWDKYGKSAGFKRNRQVVEMAELVAAFWTGNSRGTEHTIRIAMELGKTVLIYDRNGECIIVPKRSEV